MKSAGFGFLKANAAVISKDEHLENCLMLVFESWDKGALNHAHLGQGAREPEPTVSEL